MTETLKMSSYFLGLCPGQTHLGSLIATNIDQDKSTIELIFNHLICRSLPWFYGVFRGEEIRTQPTCLGIPVNVISQWVASCALTHCSTLNTSVWSSITMAKTFANLNHFELGICVRDAEGRFIKARTIYMPGMPNPREA